MSEEQRSTAGISQDPSAWSMLDCFKHTDSVDALVWASASSVAVAVALVACQRLLSLSELMGAANAGMSDLLEANLILVLAWALGDVLTDLSTAPFLAAALGGGVPPWLLPPLVLLLSMVIGYGCGSGMGTQGLIFPLALPLAVQLAPGDTLVFLQVTGAVLGGSTFGNSCSPLADTTILSCAATGCEISSHVDTITPYALVSAFSALVVGCLPCSAGLLPWYLALILSVVVAVGAAMAWERLCGSGGDGRDRFMSSETDSELDLSRRSALLTSDDDEGRSLV